MNVQAATRAFRSEASVALIRHYRLHPGSKTSAVQALNLPNAVVFDNLKVLGEIGVIVAERDPDDARARFYRVDEAALHELLVALADFTAGEAFDERAAR